MRGGGGIRRKLKSNYSLSFNDAMSSEISDSMSNKYLPEPRSGALWAQDNSTHLDGSGTIIGLLLGSWLTLVLEQD